MGSLADMVWVEAKKAIRSRMPLWTALGSLFMPFGMAFLIFVSKNPEISEKLGLISAKANLVAYSATDWAAYMVLFGQIIAAGGFFFFVLAMSWTFGREFADGTMKDLLAVPVPRGSIVLAKFITATAWSVGLALAMLLAGLVLGAVVQLRGGSSSAILQGSARVLVTACLTILLITPFALFASIGRGYLLPLGMAVLILMATNIAVLLGWGEYFPWAAAGLYAMGKSALAPVSLLIVLATGLAGMLATYLWWMHADQNR